MPSVAAASAQETVPPTPDNPDIVDTNKSEENTNGHKVCVNGNSASDSEESVHSSASKLDSDSQKINNEESEEDIMNKIDSEATDIGDDHLDSHAEDKILNGDENEIKIVFNYDDGNYEDSADGEFKSLYEDDCESLKDEPMEVNEVDIKDESLVAPPTPMDSEEKLTNQDAIMEDVEASVEAPIDNDIDTQTDKIPEDELEDDAQNAQAEEPAVPLPIKDEPTVPLPMIDEPAVPLPIKEEPDTEESNKPSTTEEKPNSDETCDLRKTPSPEDAIFKQPEELPIDKSMEDDIDLLDISMIRETEEDDACAIADAIAMEDKDTQRSDEDQSEKTETEQENSDGDGATQDDDIPNGFVVLEEDSRMDGDDDNNEPSKENSDDSNEAKEAEEEPNEEANKENNAVVNEDNDNSEPNKTDKIIEEQDKEGNNSENEIAADEDKNTEEQRKSKRSISPSETDKLNAKKPKLVEPPSEQEPPQNDEAQPGEASPEPTPTPTETEETPKLQTLTSFADFMQCRKITKKLTRSDLEEICIQKICEVLVLKSSEGELHQTIKKQEQNLAILRKDVHQLNKQYKDLDIVHKKLLAELKTQKDNGVQKPLVPLKITRSVGLQVRLSPGNEANQTRRRQTVTALQKTITSPSPLTRQTAPKVGQTSPAARQVLNSPQKPQAVTKVNAPMLSQALQQQKQRVKQQIVAKRTTIGPMKKIVEAAKKPAAPDGFIDLTDEDDKKSATNGVKFRTVPARTSVNSNKSSPSSGKSLLNQNNKAANKSNALPSALPQGLRLTPASVITSTATSSPQMLYVVPTITSNAGGQQKVAFVNFQPTLSGALNGSIVTKPGQSLTIKNVAATNTVSSTNRTKHPAPLPVPQRFNSDAKLKLTLPKPMLTIKKLDNGIILQWKMPYNLDLYETIASYQLYAYQETTALPSTEMWRKVGDVKALALPMACTLTQFADKNKYYFAVRAVDVFQRIGAFSEPEEISL